MYIKNWHGRFEKCSVLGMCTCMSVYVHLHMYANRFNDKVLQKAACGQNLTLVMSKLVLGLDETSLRAQISSFKNLGLHFFCDTMAMQK